MIGTGDGEADAISAHGSRHIPIRPAFANPAGSRRTGELRPCEAPHVRLWRAGAHTLSEGSICVTKLKTSGSSSTTRIRMRPRRGSGPSRRRARSGAPRDLPAFRRSWMRRARRAGLRDGASNSPLARTMICGSGRLSLCFEFDKQIEPTRQLRSARLASDVEQDNIEPFGLGHRPNVVHGRALANDVSARNERVCQLLPHLTGLAQRAARQDERVVWVSRPPCILVLRAPM